MISLKGTMLKEAILKGLCAMGFYLNDILKKTKLKWQRKDQWLPEARVGESGHKGIAQGGLLCWGWG